MIRKAPVSGPPEGGAHDAPPTPRIQAARKGTEKYHGVRHPDATSFVNIALRRPLCKRPPGARRRLHPYSRGPAESASAPCVPACGDRRVPSLGGGFRTEGKKKNLIVCEAIRFSKKISGTVLLSHSQIYSTIAAGGLNYRVREGNVCDSSAMGAGKNYNEEEVSLLEMTARRTEVKRPRISHESAIGRLRKTVAKPHGWLVMVS